MVRINLFLILIFIHFFGYASSFQKIIIYGEHHGDRKDQSIKKTFIHLGNQGEHYIALEGYLYGRLSPFQLKNNFNKPLINPFRTIYGIEDSLPHMISAATIHYIRLYDSLHNLSGKKNALKENMNTFMNFLLERTPGLTKVWKKIPRPFKNSQDERLAVFIDKMLSVNTSRHGSQNERELSIDFLRIFNDHPISFMNLAKSLAMEIGKYVESAEKLDVSSLYDLLNNPQDSSKVAAFINQILVKWRNQSLFKNILKIYNLAKKDKKDLIVFVGLLHVPGLKELLESSSDKIGVEVLFQSTHLNKLNKGVRKSKSRCSISFSSIKNFFRGLLRMR